MEPLEYIEEPALMRRIDPDAVVADGDANPFADEVRFHCYVGADSSLDEFNSIAQEVGNGLPKRHLMAQHLQQWLVDLYFRRGFLELGVLRD